MDVNQTYCDDDRSELCYHSEYLMGAIKHPEENNCYVNAAPDKLFLFHRQSSSSVIRSNSPTTTSQIMARKKRRGVCDFFFVFLFHVIQPNVQQLYFSITSNFIICVFMNFCCCFAFWGQIIEKRRRDRINNSLSELRRLVPTAFEKQVSCPPILTTPPVSSKKLILSSGNVGSS